MFDRLATSQNIAYQTFFAYGKQKMFLKFFKNIAKKQVLLVKECLAAWPNGETLFVKQIQNVGPIMFDRLARA